MKKDKPFYKQWKIRLIVVVLIAMPIIINCLYMAGLERTAPNTAFSASDMILFYGSFLSFLGTVSLGYVAYKQNKKANETSDKLADIAERANKIADEANKKMIEFQEHSNKTLFSCNVILSNPTIKDNSNANLMPDVLTAYNMNINDWEKERDKHFIKNAHGKMDIYNYSNVMLSRIDIDFGEKSYSYNHYIGNGKQYVCFFIPKQSKYDYICKVKFTSCYGIETYGEFQLGQELDTSDSLLYMNNGLNASVMNYKFLGLGLNNKIEPQEEK